ncbi:MAG: MFS transporter [Ktedonobacteraceae bacterium]
MESSTQATTSPRPLLIWLAFFAFALVGMGGGANGVLLPSLSNFYHVDNSVLGLLFFASTVGYLLSAFSSGIATEVLGYRWTLIVGAGMSVLGSLAFSLQPPFAIVLVMRLLMGMGAGIIEAALNSYITTLPRRTSILNNLHAFFGVGALVGPLLATGILALSLGWNWVYVVLAGLSGLLLVGLVIFFPRQGVRVEEPEGQGIGQMLSAPLRMRIVWMATLFLLFYVGVETNPGNWGYSFLTEGRHEGTLFAGWVVSGYWLGLALGRFTQPRIFERFGLGNVALLQASMVEAVIGILLTWLLPWGWTTALGLLLVGYGLGPIYPTIVAMMPGLVPARLVSSAIGFLVSLSIPGIAVFPWIAGILGQYVGLWTLWPFTLLLVLGMLIFWLPLRNHDYARAGILLNADEQVRAKV